MLSSSVFKDLNGNILDRETAVAMPAGKVRLEKRNKEVERYTSDFMLSSARLEAACQIILNKKWHRRRVLERDLTSFRSTLREYLRLKDEILKKEAADEAYIIRDDSYLVMTMYRVAYLVKKACRCNTTWYGQPTKVGCFTDYDFGIDLLSDDRLYTRFEKKMLNSFAFDPRVVMKAATFRVMVKNIPSMITGKVIYIQ